MYISPLSKIPGPRFSSFTEILVSLKRPQGRVFEWFYSLHSKYGNVVRVGPKFILFDELEAVKFILKDSDMPKTPSVAGIRAHYSLPTLFSATSFNMVENECHPLPTKIFEEMKRRVMCHTFPYFKMFFKKDPWCDEFISKIVKNRLKQNSHTTKPRIDILQILLNNHDPLKQSSPTAPVNITDGRTMSDFEIQDQIMEFLVAGSDSNDDLFLPPHENLKSLKYLNAIIDETLRLFPAALGGIMRQTTEDTIISNHLIPKDTIVSASLWKLHRSKQIWGQDVDEFVPERWFDLDPKIRSDAYYPFGNGSRLCIGINFAMMEMRIIISALIGNFEFFVKDGTDLQIVQFITPSLRSKKFDVEVTRLRECKNNDVNTA
ncbi:11737_t:CDS:2 [Gigaspora rosea]|nr:11737_t:CDS:2 [Gigaspora rosea]